MERTLIIIKPDGVQRHLVGEIVARFERCGLEIQHLQLVHASKDLMRRHYPSDEEWLTKVGGKTLKTYQTYGMDAVEQVGTADALTIGRMVKEWLVDFMTSGPVVAFVLRGNHAVDVGRKIAGDTIPLFAAPGTIRGDYAVDSPDLANAERRAVANLVHASGTPEEAEYEIGLWFPPV
jgi:nucleoside-diphosphate kinase